MVASREESYASLRLLVCMAMADGVLHDREHEAIEEGFSGADLPEGVSLDAMFSDHHDFGALLEEIKSEEARSSVYASMFALACVDGDFAPKERHLLQRAREAFGIEEARQRELERLFDSGADQPDRVRPHRTPRRPPRTPAPADSWQVP